VSTLHPRRPRDERGSAVVDFVLVLVVLVPLFLGIAQLALTLHVRNTLAAAASEGARYAAAYDRSPGDGVARTRERIRGAVAGRFAQHVGVGVESVGGAPTVVVTARAEVPALGLWGPGVPIEVHGHATREELP